MTKPARRTLAERRSEEIKLEMAMAARKIFVADGDTAATIERIAAEAGVAERTFYRHFAVKEDVVLPLFRRSSANTVEALDRTTRPELLDPLVEAFTPEIRETGMSASSRKFLTLMAITPQYRQRWMAVDEELCEAVTRFLASRVDLGTDPLQRDLSGYLIVQATRKVFDHWLITGSKQNVEVLLRRSLKLVLNGLTQTRPMLE